MDSLIDAVRAFKREYILRTLEQMDGHRTETARLLGIERTYLQRLLRTLRINGPPPRHRRRR